MSRNTSLPAYFLGIGGPNFVKNTDHPAYKQLAKIGKHITGNVKPKAIVVFGAHWQHEADRIAVNVSENEDIIYDFYGFPDDYYNIKYPNRGSPEVAMKVIQALQSAGIKVDKVHRGLDHGVWVGTLAAFDPADNPLNVPIVQVSLYNNEDPQKHFELGQAVAGLRKQGILILGAGMAVHNLHDFRANRFMSKPMPYASTFTSSLTKVVQAAPDQRQNDLTHLINSPEARRAHPTLEHILPLAVVAGAAGDDKGEEIWAWPEASLNWAQYVFGENKTRENLF